MTTISDIINLAAKLPSGLNDPRSAEKLLAERDELMDALHDGDYIGALTEGADAVYYAAKHLDLVAGLLGISLDALMAVAEAKYSLRAQPGNPKSDAAERLACVAAARSRGMAGVEVIRAATGASAGL